MINFVDDRNVFGGNLIEYEVLSSDRILAEYGGGLKIQYNVIPDHKFDEHFGKLRDARYGYDLEYNKNGRLSFNDLFIDGRPIVNIRQSVLSSDRRAAAVFNHEFFELQGLYSRLKQSTMPANNINYLIDSLHINAVKSSDSLVGRMIISEGL